VPGTSRVAVLVNPNDADIGNTLSLLPAISRSLGLHFSVIELRSVADFEQAVVRAAPDDGKSDPA
jgi:hypothetical protein